MAVVSLHVQRAQKALETFCIRHNAGVQQRARHLDCRRDGADLLLVENELSGVAAETVLVRLVLQSDCWLLCCPDRRGDWVPYPHLPRATSIQCVIDELERAPLHVYWG